MSFRPVFKLPFLESAFVHGPNLPRIPNIFGARKLKLDFGANFFHGAILENIVLFKLHGYW